MKNRGESNMKPWLALTLPAILAVSTIPQKHTAIPPFTLALSPEKSAATLGSDIWVKVRWTNISDRALDSSANILDAENVDPNFHFDLVDMTGHTVPRRVYEFPHTGGHAEFGTLQPGDSITHDINLIRLFDLKPGKYTVQVSRRAPESLGGGVIKSNVITITFTKKTDSPPPKR
jgi:hypothetical protein